MTCETCNLPTYGWGTESEPQSGICRYCDAGICKRCAAVEPEICCEECLVKGVCKECDAELRYVATDPRTLNHAQSQAASAAHWVAKSAGWYGRGAYHRTYSDQVDKWAYEAAVSAAHWGRLVLHAREYVR